MAQTRFDRHRPLGVLVKIFPKLSETFILEEILGLERQDIALRLYSLAQATDDVAHAEVRQVRAPLVRVPDTLRGHAGAFAARHARLLAHAPRRYLGALAHAARRGASGLRDFMRAGWLAAQLAEDGVDHLHAHFISSPSDVAELASRLVDVPFSISAHAKDIYLSPRDALRRKLRAARFTVTCTESNRETLAAIAPDAEVHRMYHGIDHERFHPGVRCKPADVPLILNVGRLREKKGLDTLVDACALLRDRGRDFLCEIVGYGEERQALQNRIEARRLAERVHLAGKLARDEVLKRYARAAVYVQPSRVAADGDRDGIPNVLLEAMATGLPVAATNVSGIPELVVHGRNGLLVEPDDPAALADAIARLLDHPSLCADLGCRARRTVTEHFDNDRNLGLLTRLLARDRQAAAAALPASLYMEANT